MSCFVAGWVPRRHAPGLFSSQKIYFWVPRCTWCCLTVKGWSADKLAKYTLSYSSACRCFDGNFVVSVLLDQLYVHTEHSIGRRIVRYISTLRAKYVSYFEIGFGKREQMFTMRSVVVVVMRTIEKDFVISSTERVR